MIKTARMQIGTKSSIEGGGGKGGSMRGSINNEAVRQMVKWTKIMGHYISGSILVERKWFDSMNFSKVGRWGMGVDKQVE
ncbi:hypothetical protein Leryth_001797 [Lithospermum erythrorhizon]|nr:hypothetical protein Leryth_001797 [Lithospermum erythrorhizon]